MRKLKGVVSPNTPLEWTKNSQKHDLDPLADKKFYWDSSQVSRENYAHKYDLSKVPIVGTPRILISGGDYDED